MVPPLTCAAHGNVCPVTVVCHAPVELVVALALAGPAEQTIFTVPPTTGEPTAATPENVPATPAGVVLLPPPQPAMVNNAALVAAKRRRVRMDWFMSGTHGSKI